MSRRKLEALGFSNPAIDLSNGESFRSLISWLEDQRICAYEIAERDPLNDVKSEKWPETFDKYLEWIGCPLKMETKRKEEIVEWLLDMAIDLEYENLPVGSGDENLPVGSGDKRQKSTDADGRRSSTEYQSKEFIDAVNDLANFLAISKHPDSLVTLRAIASLVASHYDKSTEKWKDSTDKKQLFELDKCDLGAMGTGNAGIDSAIRALRVLHVEQLRELQNSINQTIVAVQELTADPKTDSRLGKIGY